MYVSQSIIYSKLDYCNTLDYTISQLATKTSHSQLYCTCRRYKFSHTFSILNFSSLADRTSL